jgi:hypothetical protein
MNTLCQNKHKMIVDEEGGLIADRPCINTATQRIGILNLCEECYRDDLKTLLGHSEFKPEKN